MKKTKSPYNANKAGTREKMKSDGYFDGRFRSKTVEDKRFKKPKYKEEEIDNYAYYESKYD